MSKKWQSKQREFLKAHPKQLRRDYSRERVRVLNITEPPKNATDIAPIAKSSLTSTKNSGNMNNRNAFYTYSDPMREVLGSAYDSHPEKVKELLEYLNSVNVEVLIRNENESLGYQPSVSSGNPGQMVLNSQASISAWLHEFQHVLDDEKTGWSGMRVLYDDDEHYRCEVNAYNVEIEFAKSMGREDIVDRLKDLLEERKKIYDPPG